MGRFENEALLLNVIDDKKTMSFKKLLSILSLVILLINSCSSFNNVSLAKRLPGNQEQFFSGDVAWYSGSFDPPTRNHLAIVNEILRRTDGPIYLTVNHNTAKNFNASIRERVDMLTLAYADEPRIHILREPVEGRRFLVPELYRRHNKKVILVVGEDVLEQNYEALGDLNNLSFISFFRAGQESDYRPNGTSKVYFEELEGNGKMSSTLVRERIKNSESLSSFLIPEIEKYIKYRNLYKLPDYNQNQLFTDFLKKVRLHYPEVDLSNAKEFAFKETQSKGGQIDAMIRWILREGHIPKFHHKSYIESLESMMKLDPLPLSFSSSQKLTCKRLLMTIIN